MAETIRECIERVRRRLINVEEDKDQGEVDLLKWDIARSDYHRMLKNKWAGGNLIPADEMQARIDSAVSEAVRARDAEWRQAFHSIRATEKGADTFGPHGPEEARTFIDEGEKFAVEMERERCARIIEDFIEYDSDAVAGSFLDKIAAAIRKEPDHG